MLASRMRAAASSSLSTATIIDAYGFEGDDGLATIPISGSAAANDFMLIINMVSVQNGSGGIPPTGFTTFLNTTSLSSSDRLVVSGKKLSAANISAGSVTGMGYFDYRIYWVLIVRLSPDLTTMSAIGTIDHEQTNANPAQQTVPVASAANAPVVAFAMYSCLASGGSVDPRTSSISMTEVDEGANANADTYLKYKVFNPGDTLANFTVDMADEGTQNTLVSGAVEFS